MKLKDITFEDDEVCICPKCKIPLTFKGWIPKKSLSYIGEIIFLLFTPKSWIGSYYYQCDKCKHIYEIKKEMEIIIKMEQSTLDWWCNLTDKQRFKIIEEAHDEVNNIDY